MRIGSYSLANNLIVAPMAGVTDRPFRRLCRKLGAGLAVSEMVASNRRLRDTVQSRLPDPQWLEAWLDGQIQFDAAWEGKVVERILHNLSLLMERSFASVQELNRYRRELAAARATRGQELVPGTA